jgi:hypothetical protein
MKFITLLLAVIVTFPLISDAQVTPTNEWVNFYSTSSFLNDQPIPVGTEITAYDPDGVCCGIFIVHTEGKYGFLIVYRDDFTTPDIDEGAEPGDSLRFYINSYIAVINSGNPVWTTNGDVIQLNLKAYSNYPPVISGLPDTITFTADSTVYLSLDYYVEDLNDHDSTLHWSASGYESINVNINPSTNIAELTSPEGWTGWDSVVFTVTDKSNTSDSAMIKVHILPSVGIDSNDEYYIDNYHLYQNHPNPFNAITNIIYGIPERGYVTIKIYDLLGREVITLVNENQEAKYYKILWDAKDKFGNNVSSGAYFCRIIAESDNRIFSKTNKLLLLR